MAEQLTFKLPSREALGREAFFVSPSNAIALATLETPQNWPSGKLVLCGPKGAGKTHLAHVWANEHDAIILPAFELLSADIPMFASHGHIVVEDVDLISTFANAAELEKALFHLHNLTLAEGGRLLITARLAPNHWTIGLPDLASRMQGTTVAKINAPDDQLLGAILIKLFGDRQLAVSAPLIEFIIKRMERSADAALNIVEQLDKSALRDQKSITRKYAADILNDNLSD